MDGATGPLIALGVAVLGLGVLAIAAVVTRRPSREVPDRPSRDDLAAFHAHPPGSPGAMPLPRSGPPVLLAVPQPPVGSHPATTVGRGPAPALLALAAAVLLLLAVAAGVGLATHRAAGGEPAGQVDTPRLPALPAEPASPAAGQSGAGRLALTSLPLGPGDIATRLTLGGVVLEQQAVGVTVTYPSASVTTHGGRGLAHLRLPTFNCLTPQVPSDPIAAGCVPSVTQYADLPSPALDVTADGTRLSLQGRFPTYLRHNGTAPTYTGSVYDVTITASAGARLGPGLFAANGALSLGGQTTSTRGSAPLDVLRRGQR